MGDRTGDNEPSGKGRVGDSTHSIERIHAVENWRTVEVSEVQVSDRCVRCLVRAAICSDSVLNERRVQLDGRTVG